MKLTMRDKVCQLIGKYQAQLDSDILECKKLALPNIPNVERLTSEQVCALDQHMMQLGEFLFDLEKLLEEEEKEDTHHE